LSILELAVLFLMGILQLIVIVLLLLLFRPSKEKEALKERVKNNLGMTGNLEGRVLHREWLQARSESSAPRQTEFRPGDIFTESVEEIESDALFSPIRDDFPKDQNERR